MKSILAVSVVLVCFGFYACTPQKSSVSGTGNAEITETYWRLTELKGKPVGITPAHKKEVYIRLTKESSRLEGFGGCNQFGGTFELKEGARISFSNIMGTMMACDDTKNENNLLEVLRETDNYVHHGKNLLLNKGKKAPSARFEAVYFK